MSTTMMPSAILAASGSVWAMEANGDGEFEEFAVAFRVAVGERIRRERARRGLSQSALAHRMPAHVSASQISRWERGRSLSELRSMWELAGALDVSTDAFFCDR